MRKAVLKGIMLSVAIMLLPVGAMASAPEQALEISGLKYSHSMELTYATEFSVDYYEGGYKLIGVNDGQRYLVIPENGALPKGIAADIVPLYQPLDHVYLAATSSMALINALDCLDCLRLSGTKAQDWHIDEARAAMEAGDIRFAGKYSEPDFEMLVNEKCDLAIESTMILHAPKVKELLELVGIPVFTERSSYESHPLGRTEWIKLFGAMFNREKTAEEFFNEQKKVIDELADFENTGKTVAFFYISSDGKVVIRNANDYVPKMIEIAGCRYIFDDMGDADSRRANISISMEEFYERAIDADYLVYNSSIDNVIQSTAELLAKSELFADFKAVQEGNVWCTGKYLYQATDIVGKLITDFNKMLRGDENGMTFLSRIE